MCLFSNNIEVDLERVSALADEARRRGHPYPPQQARGALTKAIADLRRGKLEMAIKMLAVADGEFRAIEEESPALLHFYLAIAHGRPGHEKEAQAAFQTAVEKFNAEQPRSASAGFYRWFDWMVVQIVRQEAETLLKPRAASISNRVRTIRSQMLSQVRNTKRIQNAETQTTETAPSPSMFVCWQQRIRLVLVIWDFEIGARFVFRHSDFGF